MLNKIKKLTARTLATGLLFGAGCTHHEFKGHYDGEQYTPLDEVEYVYLENGIFGKALLTRMELYKGGDILFIYEKFFRDTTGIFENDDSDRLHRITHLDRGFPEVFNYDDEDSKKLNKHIYEFGNKDYDEIRKYIREKHANDKKEMRERFGI